MDFKGIYDSSVPISITKNKTAKRPIRSHLIPSILDVSSFVSNGV